MAGKMVDQKADQLVGRSGVNLAAKTAVYSGASSAGLLAVRTAAQMAENWVDY
jgi:hypothetical protein